MNMTEIGWVKSSVWLAWADDGIGVAVVPVRAVSSVLPDRAARGVGDGCDDPPCRLAMVAATTMGARNREVSWAYSSDHGEMVAIEDRLTTISP
jgi:hypothetical protein